MFTYRRPNEIRSTAGESFLAEGPTNEILEVYVSDSFRHFTLTDMFDMLKSSALSLVYVSSDDLPAAESWCSLRVRPPL